MKKVGISNRDRKQLKIKSVIKGSGKFVITLQEQIIKRGKKK